MPHVIVKMYPGRSEEQKRKLADMITAALIEAAGAKESSVSIAIDEVDPAGWPEYFKNEIIKNEDRLYKKPGYNPLV
jgi:4-oxalocrotonate tautomerase